MENIEQGVNPPNVATLNKNEVFKDLFADMLSYYVRNAKTLSKDEQGDFTRFDKANNAQQLKTWAENIHITGSMGDMTSIELANVIKNTDDTTLDMSLRYAKQSPRVVEEKTNALTRQINDLKAHEATDTVILFRNEHDNFTAVGNDAKKVAQTLGIMTDSAVNNLDVTNVNKAGAYLLFQNNVKYMVVDPITDIASITGKDNDIALTNKLMMQMGNLAVLSKGQTVRFDTAQQIFGNEQTLELKKGLFSAVWLDNDDKLKTLSLPIQQFDTHDGKSTSYLYDMPASDLKNLQTFFNNNFDTLKKITNEYGNTRRELDDKLNTLINQNDKLAAENPNTIILIKQKGYIEAFSDSAIKAANALGLQLYNRTNHKGDLTVPFTRMTAEDFKKLAESENNVYLAKPKAADRITDANVTKVSNMSMPNSYKKTQTMDQQRKTTLKR